MKTKIIWDFFQIIWDFFHYLRRGYGVRKAWQTARQFVIFHDADYANLAEYDLIELDDYEDFP